jgi:hypothetical protein
MDKKWGVVLVVLLSFSVFVVANTINNDNDGGEEQSKISGLWVWQRLRSAYSMYYSSIFPTSIGQYWHMAKTIVNHTYAYFFPPNIEYVPSSLYISFHLFITIFLAYYYYVWIVLEEEMRVN